MKIELLDEVNSTNEYIRRYLDQGEDIIVSARRQTEGRGTKGRSFLSKMGGVYLSSLTFYSNKSAKNAFEVMMHAAVAVSKTAEQFGAQPQIKWPNDVLIGSKKWSGILIENGFAGERLSYSIVGIGLNVENDVSELNGIAVSLCELVPYRVTADEVREALIANLQKEYSFSDYLSYIRFLSSRIHVMAGDEVFEATAKNILPDGRLEVVDDKGAVRLFSAAEISLKI